jgi:hypothetical protein
MNEAPGSFARWLGRQVGHVRAALRKDVEKAVVYRNDVVAEQPMPGRPDLTLRRTVRDEVLKDARDARAEHVSGKAKVATVDEIMREIES